MHVHLSVPMHVLLCFCQCATGGAADLAVIISGVAGAFVLLTLISLTVGVAIGAVLGKRVQKRKVELPGMMQLRGSGVQKGEMAEEVYDTVDDIYDVVDRNRSADRSEAICQMPAFENPTYVNTYNQIGGGTYQGLYLQGKEESHYQSLE